MALLTMKTVGNHNRHSTPSRVLRAVPLILVTLCELGCKPHSDEVVGRVTESLRNPDSVAVAEVTLSEHGVTVPDVYRVYVGNLLTGQVAEVLRADKTGNVRIAWTQRDVLTVSMACGRIFAFTNFFYLLDEKGLFRRAIEVKLETSGVCPQ